MKGFGKDEKGAALLITLLFMTLTLILMVTMLATSGNELMISGLHRDSARALELAQAGTQEAVTRIQGGRLYLGGFPSSLNSGITVTVTRYFNGSNSAYLSIQSTATAGRATRRLSSLVLARAISFPANTLTGSSINSGSTLSSQDAYSQTWATYSSSPSPRSFYAGWRISASDPTSVPYCYTNAGCSSGSPSMPNWYPGMRLSVNQTSSDGLDLVSQTNKCPAGGGGVLPSTTITGVYATTADGGSGAGSTSPVIVPVYGFDTDDPGTGPLAVTASLPCGLPYKYISKTFIGEDGATSYTRLFKTIVYEQWLNNYWQFNESQMTYVKTTSLTSYPKFSAIAPFPDVPTTPSSYDRVVTGGGTLSGDLGCKYPEMSCTPAVDRPISVLMTGGSYSDGGSTLQGHGTIVINGNFTVDGTLTYYGTIIVNGTVTINGAATVYGGLLAAGTDLVGGSLTIPGGGAATNILLGRSAVIGRSWYER